MDTLKKEKLLVILGPTATGKSNCAVKIAQQFNGEIISADSRQIYRELNIGTNKITKEEMGGVPHHLLDIVDPETVFSVFDYNQKALEAIHDIHNRKKLPILCGGTGFYIEAVVDNIVLPEVPSDEDLHNQLQHKSLEELQEILKQIDPRRLKEIDQKNSRRLIRAIEITTYLGAVPPLEKKEQFTTLQIGLDLPEEELKNKINKRLELELRNGLIEEVGNLHTNGLSFERMEALGLEYRLVAHFLQNMLSFEEVEKELKTKIWQYAKRQRTWFKKDKRIKWFNPKEKEKIQEEVEKFYNQ